jgi:predicted phosphodiesterase
MTFQTAVVISDLHLESVTDDLYETYREIASEKIADCIILCGDIDNRTRSIYFIKYLVDLGYTVFYIPGNHEYEDSKFDHVDSYYEAIDLEGFYYLNNRVAEFENFRIIGSTLWASADTLSIDPLDGPVFSDSVDYFVRQKLEFMIDFTSIHGFNVDKMAEKFKKNYEFIIEQCSKPFNGKTIVATHHAPSFESCLARYRENITNHAFASELDFVIEMNDIDYWLHGHMHNSSDYMIGDTRVICNPRGNPMTNLNWNFDKNKIISLE